MRTFVTGATGFVGGYLVRRLRERGDEVVALARNPDKARDLAALGIRVVAGDVTDRESMRAPMRGADGVFHVAGWYKVGVKDKTPGVRINIDGSRNVFELMRELEIPKGVYTSTLAVNSDTHGQVVDERYHFSGKHISEYDRTKAVAHQIADELIAQGLPLVIVMPGLIYGPGDTSNVRTTFIQYLQDKLPLIPKKSGYAWAHVEDIVTGHLLAMDMAPPGETYIIGGPCHTLVDAMQMAQEVTGMAAPRAVSPALLKGLAPIMGVIERIIPVPQAYTAESLRVTGGATYYGDNAKARSQLGYAPRSLRDGLRATLLHEMALLGMARPDGESSQR